MSPPKIQGDLLWYTLISQAIRNYPFSCRSNLCDIRLFKDIKRSNSNFMLLMLSKLNISGFQLQSISSLIYYIVTFSLNHDYGKMTIDIFVERGLNIIYIINLKLRAFCKKLFITFLISPLIILYSMPHLGTFPHLHGNKSNHQFDALERCHQ